MTRLLSGILSRIAQLEPAPPWSLLSAINAVIIGYFGLFVGTLAAYTWLNNRPQTSLLGWAFGGVCMMLFVLTTRRQPNERVALRLDRPVQSLALALLLSVGMAILLDVLSLSVTGSFLPLPELLNVRGYDVLSWILAVAFMVVVQPVAEEMLFRGIAFASFRVTFGAWGGLVLCAIAYALFHLLAYSAAPLDLSVWWYTLLLPLLAGLYFSAVRAYTGSTRAAIVAHMAFGVFALLKALTVIR
jgi:membrane protease YdiL (CAAX protease family)